MTKVNAHQSRIFSLGIGNGASHELIEGIAKAGGGTSTFCSYNEDIDKNVLVQLKNAMEPSLTGKKSDHVKPASNTCHLHNAFK